MVNLLLPLLLSLATSSINAASLPEPSLGPSNSMNLTELYSSVTNTTSLSDGGSGGIDPRFSVNYQFGGIPLRPISCLLNAVSAMINLALQDFNGNVGPFVSSLPGYSDVVIGSDATTPIRYILWAIWSFALLMMRLDVYQTMHLTLGFNGTIVGYLRIEKVLSPAGQSSDSSIQVVKKRTEDILPAIPITNSLANITEMSNNTSLSLVTNITTPSNAGELRVFINPIGHSLNNIEFFTPILAGLDHVARLPSTSPVDGFIVRPVNSDTWIEFRHYGPQPRTEAPFFEYQDVAKALGELAGQMAVLGGWSEAIVVMQVDGVSVGDGWIRKGRG